MGLFIGLEAESHVPERCASEPCLLDGLIGGLLPVFLPALAGLVGGAIVGLVLALLVRLDRPARRPPAVAPVGDARPITARYRDVCAACGAGVERGDRILYSRARKAAWCSGCLPSQP